MITTVSIRHSQLHFAEGMANSVDPDQTAPRARILRFYGSYSKHMAQGHFSRGVNYIRGSSTGAVHMKVKRGRKVLLLCIC